MLPKVRAMNNLLQRGTHSLVEFSEPTPGVRAKPKTLGSATGFVVCSELDSDSEQTQARASAKCLRILLAATPLFACQPIQIGLSGEGLPRGGASMHPDMAASAGVSYSRGGAANGGALSSRVDRPSSAFGAEWSEVDVAANGFGGTPSPIRSASSARGAATGGTGEAGPSPTSREPVVEGAAGSRDRGTVPGTGGVASPSLGGTSTTDGGSAGTNHSAAAGAGAVSNGARLCPGSPISIRGRVVSPRGQPLEEVIMTLSGNSAGVTRTNARGEYGFAQLCAGRNELTPERSDLRFCTPKAIFDDLTASVEEDFTGSPDGCQPVEISPRLKVLVFDPLIPNGSGGGEHLTKLRGWHNPAELAERYRRAIETVTNGRVRYDLVAIPPIEEFPVKADGFQYSPETYLECLANPHECHDPDLVNYSLIDVTQQICEQDANGNDLDEVWLFGGPHFGFAPLQWLVPYDDEDLGLKLGSNCFRRINVFGFSYEGDLGEMLKATQMQLETFLERVYSMLDPPLLDSASRRFTATYAPLDDTAAVGCGRADQAPNATQSGDFQSTHSVASFCDSFYDYPNADISPTVPGLTCEAWGCTEIGFRLYWLRHLPSAKGIGPDGLLADWWRYLLRPDDFVSVIRNEGITCSSSIEYNWCGSANDGAYGDCNTGEWATPDRKTGWVELAWPSSRKISSVTLYDRACAEQVLSGHLEFSDGSARIDFAALDGEGLAPTILFFPTKRLTWLRVYIDDSDAGENPGFGEIIVN